MFRLEKEFELAKYVFQCRFWQLAVQVKRAPPKTTVLRLAGARLAHADPTSGIPFDRGTLILVALFFWKEILRSLKKSKDMVSRWFLGPLPRSRSFIDQLMLYSFSLGCYLTGWGWQRRVLRLGQTWTRSHRAQTLAKVQICLPCFEEVHTNVEQVLV